MPSMRKYKVEFISSENDRTIECNDVDIEGGCFLFQVDDESDEQRVVTVAVIPMHGVKAITSEIKA